MANLLINRTLTSIGNSKLIGQPPSDGPSSFFTFSSDGKEDKSNRNAQDDSIYVKSPFYNQVTTRPADDGNGWTVMLDYRTLKTPSKRPLKLPTLALAKAIAAEWEYQETDGIRPFTMPLMKHACTALERVPLTRPKVIDYLMKKFNEDLVFCCAYHYVCLYRQVEKVDPLLDWVKSEFGFKPAVYSSFFGGKQEDGLTRATETLLKQTDDCELAAIDAIASSAHSLIIAIGVFRGKLQIEEAIELIRLEEDIQVDRWGLVEGGHDVDAADLGVQISSATVFLGLSRT
ncbi:unnamed protein product [Malus baccata var. baccata]